MADRMAAQGVEFLWLDATGLESFDSRFPTVAASLHAAGLDPAEDWLPIAPAAHYVSGGVVTDLDGASALPGLWAAGEAACTGVHGANRLASNSLLEGMVFGARLAEAIADGRDGPTATGVMRGLIGATAGDGDDAIACVTIDAPLPPARHTAGTPGDADTAKLRDRLQRAMTEGAGVLRSPASLAGAAAEVVDVGASLPEAIRRRDAGELTNLVTVAEALLHAALARQETRGAHARRDHPDTRPRWRCRLVHRGTDAASGAGP
jgi:L-aspartate oxidase